LPPIRLLDGKVKLIGTIDRIDEYGDYIRVVDYKTGSVDKERVALFNGTKLQLYLYAKVLKDKKLAGAYYMPISNDFNGENNIMFVGDSLLDDKVLSSQDQDYKTQINKIIPAKFVKKDGTIKNALTEEDFSAICEYAVKVAEQLALNMKEGFIPASPLKDNDYFNPCENCSYNGICEDHYTNDRKNDVVLDSTIIDAIKEVEKKND
ncbi:MAG: PD-(D/E)XK nuclease family protein, partial [Firmicutes bacterium]|nr:PD-(D/E)XK nuclease family protein [Candidatus Caballimonas caccae]